MEMEAKKAQEEAQPAAKKVRARRAERTEKEKVNDERLRARIARAKEIRAADPSMKWTAAVKQAAKEEQAAQKQDTNDSD